MNLLKEIALPLKGWVIAAARDDRNRYAHRQENLTNRSMPLRGRYRPSGRLNGAGKAADSNQKWAFHGQKMLS